MMSVIRRFYRVAVVRRRTAAARTTAARRSARRRTAGATIGAALVLAATRTPAQTPAPPVPERPPLGSHVTVAPLGDLPSSADLFSLLDAAIPEVIADRIDTGGLSTGDPARTGAHGSSWTQTRYRVGDADITDPTGSGTPLLLPRVDAWDRVDVLTGLMPISVSAPGLAITLTPRRPADSWLRVLDVAGSLPGLIAGSAQANPPAIARLDAWADANLLLSGPLVRGTLGLLLTTTGTRSSRFERASVAKLDANLASSFAHLLYTPTATDTVSAVGWVQRSRYPFPNRIPFAQPAAGEQALGIHGQVAWNRRGTASDWSASSFASITAADRSNDLAASSSLAMERLRDGPVPQLLAPGTGTTRVWSIGARVTSPTLAAAVTRQQAMVGVEAEGSHADLRPAFAGRIGETVNGLPARVWDFSAAAASQWSGRVVTVYGSDRIELHPRVTIDGALRVEAVDGTNSVDATTISWRNWMPRVGARLALTGFGHIAAFGGFGRYGHRLPLNDLAWGDPTAPVGRVYLWNTTNGTRPPLPGEIGTLVARVGPGSGGNPGFSAIDPHLRRPFMDEIITGFEARPTATSFVRLSAIGRREHDLIGVVDIGVPESTYLVSGLPDKGVDLFGSADDQILPVFNRARSTLGADRYLLTNPSEHEATFVGADLTYQTQTEHLFLLMGATAGRSEGLSANRGFNALENDAAVVGEVFIDPNARTYAQGRLFTERGYTLKWSGAYHFPSDATVGVIARYQDGQHFARLVIVQGLNQGVEAIRAFRNGRTRFTYTLTIDVRLQKGFAVGRYRVTGLIDVFNLLNKAIEVEEFPVTGPLSRLTAASQPPRAIHVGARLSF
jgi:hypothetical protein